MRLPSIIPHWCSHRLKPIKVYKTGRNSCLENYTNINDICNKLQVFIEVAINVTRKGGLNCDPFKIIPETFKLDYICSRKFLVSIS